jgi:hypothetical protein
MAMSFHLNGYKQQDFWTVNDCTPVLFTDDSRFCVDFTDRRARVWRSPNECLAPACVVEHDRFDGGSVMVWAGISAQRKTDLHIIENGTVTAVRHMNEILDVHVRTYAGAVDLFSILWMTTPVPFTQSPHHKPIS